MSTDAAVAELLRHSGTQFDPEVVAAFQEELANPSRERPAISVDAGLDDRLLSASVG